METKIKTAPANIMFVLDNSGSMNWEYMTPEQDGKFNGESYLFSGLSGTQKIMWKSRWSGYNAIYYNTHSTYLPWPRWEQMASTEDASGVKISNGGIPPMPNADIITPRQNPIYASPTFDLLGTHYANMPINQRLIVDNQDGAPAFTTTAGTWNESVLTPEWEGSSVYSGSVGATAVFTPKIALPKYLTASKYKIYAWWNCYTGRDRNALVVVDHNGDGTADASQRIDQHASQNNTPESGVCGEWIPLFSGASFTFPASGKGNVKIIRDASSTPGTSTIADAIAFVADGATVNISNAHYYIVDDKNGNGAPDDGEVYLVNFTWNDLNGDSVPDQNEIGRDFFLVHDNGAANNREVVQYVTPVFYDPLDPANDDVPDSIQAGVFDEQGNRVSFISDYEDLQNFANWFSFYRKRDLTAKAAVSRSINDLFGVNIGYYTINSGVRVEVQPVNELIELVSNANTVIVDNRDNAFTSGGTDITVCTRWRRGVCRRWSTVPAWQEGRDNRTEYNRSGLFAQTAADWAKWTPNIPADGAVTVSAWWPCNTRSDQKAKFTITHAGGTTVKYLNQRASRNDRKTTKADCSDPSGSGCCGDWVDLGTYNFNQGRSGSVMVERHTGSTGDRTQADAVRFTSTTSQTVNSTDILLDKLYSVSPSGYTPLRQGLQSVGRYFDADDGQDGIPGAPNPYYSEADGGSCQQAYAIAMTDGYWNGSSPGVGNVDGGSGAPYEDNFSNTLADVAMYYYDRDLSAALPNEVPSNNYDKNNRQHMVTFSISIGLSGSIPLDDLNQDGVVDPAPANYAEDPYFLNPLTPYPTWPDPTTSCWSCPYKIDDLLHASVNGRGRFFQARDPDALVYSLNELFKDIGGRIASGASVSVNGDELSSGLVLYQSTYESGNWIGDLRAYPVDYNTGEVDRANPLWEAQDKLQGQHWDTGRNIITYTGTPGSGVPFRYADLAPAQQKALDNKPELVDYIRGREVSGFRPRLRKLGDIVHSAPLLTGDPEPADNDGLDNDGDGMIDEAGEMVGGTIFSGGNDGMLHAFDAQSGEERFAYIPLHSFAYLKDLADPAYEHRYYVDATPYATDLVFLAGDRSQDGRDNDGDGYIDSEPGELLNGDDENYSDGVDNDGDGEIDEPSEKATLSLLVGALKKGGRGIYALDITNIEDNLFPLTEASLSSGPTAVVRWEYPPVPATGLEYVYAGDQTGDGVDNDGDGYFDTDANEPLNGDTEDYSDGFDNDGDGTIDEEGEMALYFDDNDMGYSFSDPFIARSYKSFNESFSLSDNPWVVIFGNGYNSVNGNAVLYILDAWTGDLIRKIDTGVGPNNGLSTPALVDVDNDDRVDYVYAGDLLGNMWKFDLTDPDPQNWGVSFGTDVAAGNPVGYQRIDYADVDPVTGTHDEPKPLFTVTGQPVTTAPDVAYHCEEDGYMVVFGTGKYLGETDGTDTTPQTIFGIWDFDTKSDHSPDYALGTWDRVTNTLSNPLLTGVQLLKQTEIDWRQVNGKWLRTLSDNKANWYLQCSDGVDNDGDGQIDEDDSLGHPTPELCIPVTPAAYLSDNVDNNNNNNVDEAGENIGHAGWFFDLPYKRDLNSDGLDNDGDGSVDEGDEFELPGERVIKDVIIRGGKAIVISFIPEASPCTGGGKSIVHEMDFCDGSRTDTASFDVNGDGLIDDSDMIQITDNSGNKINVAPTGVMYDGLLHTPVVVKDPDEDRDRELKIFSSSSGTTEILWEKKVETGISYWREH
ncbi:MAG: hypothetical protein Kow0089_02650 [Desulfobulbaceae bacterium]